MEEIPDKAYDFVLSGEFMYCAEARCPHCDRWDKTGSFTIGEVLALATEHLKTCSGVAGGKVGT